jgi:hypothetical protein
MELKHNRFTTTNRHEPPSADKHNDILINTGYLLEVISRLRPVAPTAGALKQNQVHK